MRKVVLLSILLITVNSILLCQSAKFPYPIIFVHGINSDENCFVKDGDDNDLIDFLKKIGLIDGGILNITLTYSRNTNTLMKTKEDDVHLFDSGNPNGDYFRINFNTRFDGTHGERANDNNNFYISDNTNQIIINTPSKYKVGDIISIDREYMIVTELHFQDVLPNIHVQRGGILNSVVTSHNPNSTIWNLSLESNQASIAKQGLGLKKAIERVKNLTSSSKVILVGHSMGGLAIREYVQSDYYQDNVAKVVTTGTPHLGSKATDIANISDVLNLFVGVDPRSDAARDLSYNYNGPDNSDPEPPYGNNPDSGVYLFGGDELYLISKTSFYNPDINANGTIDSNTIIGLNEDLSQLVKNPAIAYTWIVSTLVYDDINLGGDGCVRAKRQFPWNQLDSFGNQIAYVGELIIVHDTHLEEPANVNAIIRGLDEPHDASTAYEINENRMIKGFITIQPDFFSSTTFDHDYYKITVAQKGLLTLTINSSYSGVFNWQVRDSNDLVKRDKSINYSDPLHSLDTLNINVDEGIYFIKVTGDPSLFSNTWQNPYSLQWQLTPTVFNNENTIWTSQLSGITNNLYGVSFLDHNNGTAVSLFGEIVHTTDGGTTWLLQSSGTTAWLSSVSYPATNKIATVGLSAILSTTDGGSNWSQQTSANNNWLHGVSFIDNNIGFAVGEDGTIIKTINSGANWIAQTSGTADTLRGVSFINSNYGSVVGSGGIILRTTNGGTDWTSQTSGTTIRLNSVSFTDVNNGTTVGGSGTINRKGANGIILRTTNGGSNWSIQLSGYPSSLWGVSFTDANNGTVVGENGTILRTTNGGTSWSSQTSGTTNSLYAVSFTDANTGIAVGENGTILSTTNGALPVELTLFNGQRSGNNILLNWETATEVNNYGFEIERKTNNTSWRKIGFISGHGNSNSPKEYNFVDSDILNDKVLYRLKQIDFDGKYEYSKEIVFNIEAPKVFSLSQNFPNPFNPSTKIKYSISTTCFVKLKIYDVLGRELLAMVNAQQNPGSYEYIFNGSKYSSGIYFYELQAGDYLERKKLTLMK
jgi:photosystem II stability/assembly factor-like uncharacterized protein